MLQSKAYDSPKEAGQVVKRLQEQTGPLPPLLQEIPLQQLSNVDEVYSALQLLLAAKD